MKSFDQIAQAMYLAFVKKAGALTKTDAGQFRAWDQQPPDVHACWVAAAQQAAAELALVR